MNTKTLRNTVIALILILFAVPALAQDATEEVIETATIEATEDVAFVQFTTPVPELTEGQEQFIDGLDCEIGEECVTVSIEDLLQAGADSVPNPESILDPESFETLVWALVWIAVTIVLGWVFTKWGDVFIMALNAAKEGAPEWVVEATENSTAEALQTLDTTITGRVEATASTLDDLAYERFRKIVLKVLDEVNGTRNVASDIDTQIFYAQEGNENE